MSVEPPSSGRPTRPPTGPPSGPLSGPSGPPAGPPSQPPGGGGQDGGPHRPWWRSAPRIAMLTTAVVVAAALAVVLTRVGGGSGRHGEVFLQAADSAGQDPFTESSAEKSSVAPVTPAPAASAAPADQLRGVDGGAPGLYSGTRYTSSCDVEKQIKYFQDSPPRNKAFASQVGVRPAGVPAYLRSLTPVQLRADTRVTNHGYRDGNTTAYQSVLQTGTAVLVDGHGMPRVRCACGNPLTPPVAQQSTPTAMGTAWPAYRPSNVVVVTPAAQIIDVFVIFDHERDDWFGRDRGDGTGRHDRPAKPPADPNPMYPPPQPGCPPTPGQSGASGTTQCPPASTGPSRPSGPGTVPKSPPSNSPAAQSPGSKSPSSESPSSKSPSSESPPSGSPPTESPKSESPSAETPNTESPSTEGPSSAQPVSPASSGPQSSLSSPGSVSEGPGSPQV
ncbi:DUF6777 domain-containing protein [Streptomyces sp. NPDC091217]|uniref:DUF6777 domain-containing protein n=1 Tax=Streptomyces sp. NPDC091217 TaxID=3365975 RepID=UPI0037FD0E74